MKKAEIRTPLPLFYVGKDLVEGPLPAIFYFALSAKESLLEHPYNSPVSFFKDHNVRIFSVDLPFHGENLPAVEALTHWAESFTRGDDFLTRFLSDLEESLTLLFTSQLVNTRHIAAVGLSRGSFIAAHIAARFPLITHLLTFAPLTHLENIKEFHLLESSPLIEKLKLSHIQEVLSKKTIRTYIGGRDTRTNTDLCYAWIRSLIETAHQNKVRSPPIEFILKPSIGHKGHGTSPETFKEGALWIKEQLSL